MFRATGDEAKLAGAFIDFAELRNCPLSIPAGDKTSPGKGWHKFIDSKWMGTGEALLDFWKRGLKMTPKPAISFDWYRSFIEYLVNSEAHTWFSKIIIFAELAVAAGLILGAFVGVAAFFGGMMNWSFIMAGSASTNGMLFAIATWLVLAWRNAGWIGLDRWLLPMVGTPWKPGRLFEANRSLEAT